MFKAKWLNTVQWEIFIGANLRYNGKKLLE